MEIKRYVTGILNTNTYFITDGRNSIVIDPGIDGLTFPDIPDMIINTHGHFDHIAGNRDLKKRFGSTILIHPYDKDMLSNPELNGSTIFGKTITSPPPDKEIMEGDKISFGKKIIRVIHTPGHSPGSVCLMMEGFLFSGDTIMLFGTGRTDIPGGSDVLLWQSITKILELPDDLFVYPGHGPPAKLSEIKGGLGYAY